MSLSPSVDAARAEQKPGRCAYCDRALGPGHRFLCARAACRTTHRRDYVRDYKRHVRGSTRENPRKDGGR